MDKFALLSVYEKTGIAELASSLVKLGYKIISSGGTAKELKNKKIPVVDVSDFTGFPELFDGRVKTLHPKIHGGILFRREMKKDRAEAEMQGIKNIEVVAVNLYPFESGLKKDASHEEMVELIDIGGPALLRAAAKNYKDVFVLSSPSQYDEFIRRLKEGTADEKYRLMLAWEAWNAISHYDVLIEKYFSKILKMKTYPRYMNLTFEKKQDLRYGENPHQTAALYIDNGYTDSSIVSAEQLQGKQLSYNNILDADSALKIVKEFDEPTAVIIKHNNPCGVASSEDIVEAFKVARSVDPEAAFGGVIGVNRKVDSRLAEEILSKFAEVVVAPDYGEDALKLFSKKQNLRLLKVGTHNGALHKTYRSIDGGLLVQDSDGLLFERFEVVTKRKPTEEERKAMVYAWKIAKHVKSNAIVYAKENRAVGIGAGQMKRIDAAKLGAMIAKDFGESLEGCAMASDGFFPFRDGIDYAASLGIRAIIQPGGSIKDKEVIAAADEHGITMVFTGTRHFRH
ncbi:MAG: bifunctional phosphoribosylaminoimidazolecarboxamide formyltransferase/IMP cyclohydrolase [Candidatus Anstonellales archaeon]